MYAVDPNATCGTGWRRSAFARSDQSEGRARDAVQRAQSPIPTCSTSGSTIATNPGTIFTNCRISTGERTLIRKNTDRIAGWIFDLQGNLRLAQRVQDSGDQEILRVDSDGFTPIYTCTVFETCDVVQFHRDGQRAYIQTNKGEPGSH